VSATRSHSMTSPGEEPSTRQNAVVGRRTRSASDPRPDRVRDDMLRTVSVATDMAVGHCSGPAHVRMAEVVALPEQAKGENLFRWGPGHPRGPYRPTMGKFRVAWAVTVLVAMVATVGLAAEATKLVGDGTARQFSIEPTSADYEAAAAGQNLMGYGYLIFAGLAVLSVGLLRQWWVAAGLLAPVAVGIVGSMIFTPWGAGLATFLGVPLAFVGAGAGVLIAVTRLVDVIKERRPQVQPD